MTDSQRINRQTIIAIVFFLIVGGIGFGIYHGVVSNRPTPTPNPTINLAPIHIVSTKLFNIQNNDYDFLAKVNNPNTDYGSPDVEYEIKFYDSAGRVVSSKTGSFYILPGQTKYIIESPLKFQTIVSRADLKVISADWQKLQPFAASGDTLVIKNVVPSKILLPNTFLKVGGEVYNGSNLDLNRVDISVVALDSSGEPLAINKSSILTFLAGTTREFEVTWFAPFVGTVSRIDAEAYSNLFENSNFILRYGGKEKFKQLY